MLHFEDSYFEGEEREGFFVEEKMKRAWAAQLEVLKIIENLCRKHGLKYFAHAGTLLGAVRHKGFIPWDDDMDIGMLREDYEAFLSIAKKELPEGCELFCMYTQEDYTQNFARVTNGDGSRLFYGDEEHLKKWHGCPYIIGIDIFPWDYISRDEGEEELREELIMLVIEARAQVRKAPENAEEGLQLVEQYCGVKLDRTRSVDHQLLVLLDRLSQMFSAQEADDAARIYSYVRRRAKGDRAISLPKSKFAMQAWMPFEITQVAVPLDTDLCLRSIYGDSYMVPKRYPTHDYPFYDRQDREYKSLLAAQRAGQRQDEREKADAAF